MRLAGETGVEVGCEAGLADETAGGAGAEVVVDLSIGAGETSILLLFKEYE